MSKRFHNKILRRRKQLAVHSYIYYELNDNIISDDQWQRWANELVQLHAKSPEYTDEWDEYFKDWDGSTGFHLCKIMDLNVMASRLLRYRDEHIA